MTERKRTTTAAGVPVSDNQNSLTAGARGPDPIADNPSGSRWPFSGR